jgi:nucleoside-diphosphate-sugar epimerase
MEVFVTGGTGAIGRYVVPTLLDAGHRVTALARSPAKAAVLAGHGATPVTASLFDRVGLAAVLAGHDAVANLATAIPPTSKFMRARAWRENDRIRTHGSAAVVDAALTAGVGIVVQESITMLYPDSGSAWIDEDAAPDAFPLARSSLAAEANAERFSARGGKGVVLRFGLFYGPGASHSEQMLGLARRGIVGIMGPPDGYVSSIHVSDAATAVAAGLQAPAGTYNVVDDEPLTKREYGTALERAAGRSARLRGPGRAALLLGDRLASQTRSMRISNARFKAATDWEPRHPSARQGWVATARVLEQGRGPTS